MISIGQRAIVLTRRTGGLHNAAGVWLPGAASSVTISGAIQPSGRDEAQFLGDGLAARVERKIYTAATLKVWAEGVEGDSLTEDGRELRVVGFRDYSNALPGIGAVNHRCYYLAAFEGEVLR
jgi:hypothetical protein